MDSGGAITWDDIAGQAPAKALIQEVVVWPMLNPHIFTVRGGEGKTCSLGPGGADLGAGVMGAEQSWQWRGYCQSVTVQKCEGRGRAKL